jgi:hypothetical protein
MLQIIIAAAVADALLCQSGLRKGVDKCKAVGYNLGLSLVEFLWRVWWELTFREPIGAKSDGGLLTRKVAY